MTCTVCYWTVKKYRPEGKSHKQIVIRQKLRELGGQVLMPLPNSPDLALGYYCLSFAVYGEWFCGEKSGEAYENQLSQILAKISKGFCESDIMI